MCAGTFSLVEGGVGIKEIIAQRVCRCSENLDLAIFWGWGGTSKQTTVIECECV